MATANEVLSDPDVRAAYDEARLHPERRAYNNFRYYQAVYQPKATARGAAVSFAPLPLCALFVFARTPVHRPTGSILLYVLGSVKQGDIHILGRLPWPKKTPRKIWKQYLRTIQAPYVAADFSSSVLHRHG